MNIQSNISIFYYLIKNKKINGSLFYCFEHFVFLNKYKHTTFFLYDCSEEDLTLVVDIFKDRYNFDYCILDRIVIVNSVTELYKIESDKCLFLDTRSFEKVFRFTTIKECLVYCNDYFKPIKSKFKKIKYYGYYDYQNFEVEQMLQINFDIFKPIKNKKTDTAFVSSPYTDQSKLIPFLDIKEPNIITKGAENHHKNLFEKFDTLYIYQIRHDVNNRAIPEAFFYSKKVVVKYKDNTFIDSVKLRYDDCMDGNLKKYWLDDNNKIIKSMLEQNITIR